MKAIRIANEKKNNNNKLKNNEFTKKKKNSTRIGFCSGFEEKFRLRESALRGCEVERSSLLLVETAHHCGVIFEQHTKLERIIKCMNYISSM